MLKKALSLFFLLTFLFFGYFGAVHAQSIESLNKLIDEYTSQIKLLQGKANTLSNQIYQFDSQIKLTETKIAQTQEQIKLLGGRIDQLSSSLGDLSKAFESRVLQTYYLTRISDPSVVFLASDDMKSATRQYYYLKKIQESDRNLLSKLQNAHDTYSGQKVEYEDLEKVLGAQKSDLNSQKQSKANLLLATKNDEKKYQELLAEANAQLAALKRFVTNSGGASILSNQTKCDDWGCYYNQRDASWGNMSLGGSSYSVAEYGCLVSSISMLASHYGKNIKPNDIAAVNNAFVPGTGYLYHSFSVNGVSVNVSSVSKSLLDSELAAGRPVIAGLYSGPDHFIVILKKEGDSYIMHDPFMENGNNRPLTDQYNVSNISSLRLVSFN